MLAMCTHKSNLRINRCSYLSLCRKLYKICQPEAASGPISKVISIPDSPYTSTTIRTTGLSGNKGSMVEREAIPPVSFKVVERIWRWKYVDFANLLIPKDDAFSMVKSD